MIIELLTSFLETFSYFAIFIFIALSHVIPIPEEAILIAAGYAASLEFGNVWVFIAISLLGILLADNFAFFVGKKKGEEILRLIAKRFSITQRRVDRTKAFFQKHSGKSVFLARFLIGFRFLMPYMAGSLNLSTKKFFFFNLLGAIIWIPGIIILSYWLSGIFDIYSGIVWLKHWIWISVILIVGFAVGWKEFWKD